MVLCKLAVVVQWSSSEDLTPPPVRFPIQLETDEK